MRTKRSSVLALVILGFAALAGSSAYITEAGPQAEAAAPAAALSAPAPAAGSCTGDVELFPAAAEEPFDIACGKCANRCFSDAQCTAQCGGFPGSCVQVNSCCRQCLCAGYAVEQAA